jgi:hypothetical protein
MRAGVVVTSMLLLGACALTRPQAPGPHGSRSPYRQSPLIRSVSWDFTRLESQRRAHGSDLWPCAWSADDDLYCAWGDGGGFDGDADTVGRVSLGFARIHGTPDPMRPDAWVGRNIWGSPPYAAVPATFGGKVGSLVAVNGVLYAHGGFWTPNNTTDPVHHSGRGPLNTIAWSADSGFTWQLAPWSTAGALGSFLDTGRDSTSAPAREVLLYYLRDGDNRHLYLQRIAATALTTDPATGRRAEYFSGTGIFNRAAHWSTRETDAVPVFADANNVEGPSAVYDAGLGRFLLTAGHYASGRDDDSSSGQVGLFEAPHPWGPWRTVGYYDDWGGVGAATLGDYLSLRLPSKWMSTDGKTAWAVFSGLNAFDSFNVVKAVFNVRGVP